MCEDVCVISLRTIELHENDLSMANKQTFFEILHPIVTKQKCRGASSDTSRVAVIYFCTIFHKILKLLFCIALLHLYLCILFIVVEGASNPF